MIVKHLSIEEYEQNIGKKVRKSAYHNRGRLRIKSGNIKPFKSGEKENTVKGVIMHPQLHVPAYIFLEDDSYVECRRCSVVEE